MDVARTDGLYTIVSQNTTDMGTKGNWEDIKIDSDVNSFPEDG